jgi:hypothetical protein
LSRGRVDRGTATTTLTSRILHRFMPVDGTGRCTHVCSGTLLAGSSQQSSQDHREQVDPPPPPPPPPPP